MWIRDWLEDHLEPQSTVSCIWQWTRAETELRLEPLIGRLTWIRVHKLEPCNCNEHDNERGIRYR